MELVWSFDVEREGEDAYVIERQRGVPGCIKHGPMPRDFAGPFIDERKEALSSMVERCRAAFLRDSTNKNGP